MSRYCGPVNVEPMLKAAAHWRDAALRVGASVFTSDAVWTTENLVQLDQHFVKQPDDGDAPFIGKLETQLRETSPSTKKLAAEMLWLLYLCPSNISAKKKIQKVSETWRWSGAEVPVTPWLSEDILSGIGSAGTGFHTNLWRELAFLVEFSQLFIALPKALADELLGDPWKFDDWLKNVEGWDRRQFRHMLLFLLFPDSFERIFGRGDRTRVLGVFGAMSSRDMNELDPVDVDRELSRIRSRLEEEYQTTDLDYYVEPLRSRWLDESISRVAKAITREHVIRAIREIDQDGVPAGAQSTGYDLVLEGKRYPPKLVLSLASKYANGKEFSRNQFSGGVASPAFRILSKLGFEIVEKDLIGPLVTRFLAQAAEGTELAVRGYLEEYRDLRVRVSFGRGNLARIPWIAFLADGQEVTDGIYPVLLLFKEHRLLLLCYGLSETNEPESSWGEVVRDAKTVEDFLREKIGKAPDRYGSSFVKAAYAVDGEIPMQLVSADLDELVDAYEGVLNDEDASDELDKANLVTGTVSVEEACASFSSALHDANVSFGSIHDELAKSFLAAIVSKPFAILTGLSGSGKTQIALKLGEWIGDGRLYVAPVRPDWTGAEALFGYEDGLKPAIDGRAAWAVPAPLEFMLRAAGDPANPYLLVLDEMNLAHVERYFADALSGIESGQPCIPNLVRGQDGVWRLRLGSGERIPLPRNLWIVGTVNVDETTYMFSPKVLDRANVFEFRVATDDIGRNLKRPEKCKSATAECIRALLAVSRDDSWHLGRGLKIQGSMLSSMRALHALLAQHNLEFGHRVLYEAVRFASVAYEAGLTAPDVLLDRIVLQKILPRLHGSRKRLESPILALLSFSLDPDASVILNNAATRNELGDAPEGVPRLRGSYEKLSRMLRLLRINQFASFAE